MYYIIIIVDYESLVVDTYRINDSADVVVLKVNISLSN